MLHLQEIGPNIMLHPQTNGDSNGDSIDGLNPKWLRRVPIREMTLRTHTRSTLDLRYPYFKGDLVQDRLALTRIDSENEWGL